MWIPLVSHNRSFGVGSQPFFIGSRLHSPTGLIYPPVGRWAQEPFFSWPFIVNVCVNPLDHVSSPQLHFFGSTFFHEIFGLLESQSRAQINKCCWIAKYVAQNTRFNNPLLHTWLYKFQVSFWISITIRWLRHDKAKKIVMKWNLIFMWSERNHYYVYRLAAPTTLPSSPKLLYGEGSWDLRRWMDLPTTKLWNFN